MREYNIYHHGRDCGGGGYRGRSKTYDCSKFMENKKGENKLVKEIDFAPAAQHKRELSYLFRNCVTLDTYRTSSIAGEQWLDWTLSLILWMILSNLS